MHNTSKNAQAISNNKEQDTDTDRQGPSRLNTKKAPSSETLSLSNKEIEGLLKHGAYDMFREEKEGVSEMVSKNFNDADIDSILARSTVILHDSNASSDTLSKKLPNFSTASFVSSGEQTVDVDDPDFWTKVVGLTMDEDAVVALGKRKCRENSFINYADNGFNFKTNMYQEAEDGDSSGLESASGSASGSNVDSDDDDAAIFEPDSTIITTKGGGKGRRKRRSSAVVQAERALQAAEKAAALKDGSRRRHPRGSGSAGTCPRRAATPLEVRPADWSVDTVSQLANTLMECGYGNWEQIRHQSKLHFSLYDIALGEYWIHCIGYSTAGQMD